MDTLINFFELIIHYIKDPGDLVRAVGLVGIIIIVFVETGLLLGFFLPGDSLLLTAGLFAAKGDLDIGELVLYTTIAAIVGDGVGYFIGRKGGEMLYNRKDNFFFKKSHLLMAHQFYETHGGKTIILARFVPIIRTFAPTVAGAARMSYKKFFAYNIIGGAAWVSSMCFGGYFLGALIPNIEKYIHLMVVIVVILSLIPGVIMSLKSRNAPKPK